MTEQQLKYAIDYGKRIDSIDNKKIDVMLLPYYFVKKEFYNLVNEDLIKGTKECLKLLDFEYKSLTYNKLIGIFLYLYDEILTENGLINKLENEFLSSEPDHLMLGAGVKMLAPFNYQLTIRNLCKEMNMSFKEVEQLPYYELLDMQVALFRESKVQSNYNELLNKKK